MLFYLFVRFTVNGKSKGNVSWQTAGDALCNEKCIGCFWKYCQRTVIHSEGDNVVWNKAFSAECPCRSDSISLDIVYDRGHGWVIWGHTV